MHDKSTTNQRSTPPKKSRLGRPFRTVRYGSTAIPIYVGKTKGKTRYTIAFYLDRMRKRRTFGSLEVAKKEALLVAQQIQSGNQHSNSLRPHQRESYLAAVKLLKNADIPLVTAIEEYVQCKEMLAKVPLLSAVEEFKRRSGSLELGVKVPQVVEELLQAKRQDNLSDRYLLQLKSNLGRFASAFDRPILDVKSSHIDDWLRGHNVAPRTRNGLLTTIRVLFNFAKKRSYLPKEEVTEADVLGKVRVGDVETNIFTPAEFETLIQAAPARLIPILAMGAFAGLRMAELSRLDWSAVDLDRRLIEVRAGQAKTASRRIIPIPNNLSRWLWPIDRKGLVMPDNDLYRQVTALARELTIRWPRNVLRQSFISYRVVSGNSNHPGSRGLSVVVAQQSA